MSSGQGNAVAATRCAARPCRPSHSAIPSARGSSLVERPASAQACRLSTMTPSVSCPRAAASTSVIAAVSRACATSHTPPNITR